MVSDVPVFLVGAKVADIEKALREHVNTYRIVNYLYFTDTEKKLVGVMSIRELLTTVATTVSSDMFPMHVLSVRAGIDQEHVALMALEYNIKAVPVTDSDGTFLGVVTSDTILSILHSEHIEDALHRSGTRKFDDPIESLRSGGAWLHFKKRIPWLILGLTGGVGAALIVESFEETLQELLILATFIPMVVYMADAVGSQSQTIFIRSLALPDELGIAKYVFRELKVTLLIALVLSVLVYVASWFIIGSAVVSAILGLTIVGGVLASVGIAMTLPYVFKRLNFDPALASGPFATVLCDSTSLIIYFSIAKLLL